MMNTDFIQFMLCSSDIWLYGFLAVICIAGITVGLKMFAYMADTMYRIRKQLRCDHKFEMVKQCKKCDFIYNDN